MAVLFVVSILMANSQPLCVTVSPVVMLGLMLNFIGRSLADSVTMDEHSHYGRNEKAEAGDPQPLPKKATPAGRMLAYPTASVLARFELK